VLVLLAGSVVVGAQFAEYPSGWTHGQDVSPTFDGWARNPDGTYSFYFGYLNRNSAEDIDIPLGPDNTVDGGGDRGQPTHFYPGRRWWVYRVIAPADWPKDQRVVWTLKSRGRTNQAKAWLQPEWEVGTDLISRNARDPFLFLRGDDRGPEESNSPPAISGPPRQTLTVSETAALAVTATDDGRPKPADEGQARPRPHGLRFRWILYRGVGPLRFEPETSGPSPTSPARAETKVKFNAPGQYRVRAIASDGIAFSTFDIDVTVNAGGTGQAVR
jgi:hypothetical protein